MAASPGETGRAPATRGRGAVRNAAILMGSFLALLWLIQISDQLSGYPLLRLGIDPRTVSKLEDIFSAPFIHVSYRHLLDNSLPLLILGFLTALRGLRQFLLTTVIVIVVSGLGVWLTAPSGSDTVGASGVIFGYFGFLVAVGVFERRLIGLVVALAVGVIYWTILPDLLPGRAGISWQGHLFGLLGGVLAAWALRRRPAAVRSRRPARAASAGGEPA